MQINATKSKRKLLECFLVIISLVFGYLILEISYRAYEFYKYAIETNYGVATVKIVSPSSDVPLDTNGDKMYLFGMNPPNMTALITQYDAKNNLTQQQKVHYNNFGWVSYNDYYLKKDPGEFRIAIIGDSLTACVNNNIPWPDVVQRYINKDNQLLKALNVNKITILNLGVPGASMQFMAYPLSFIAKLFDSDMVVLNFVIEDLARRHADISLVHENLIKNPDKIISYMKSDTSPIGPPQTQRQANIFKVEGIEIPFYCSKGELKLSNPYCKVSPLWSIPENISLDKKNLENIKKIAGRKLVLHRTILSTKPLLLMYIMQKIQPANAAIIPPSIATNNSEDITIGLQAFNFIKLLHKNTLLTHNILAWHLDARRTPLLDQFIAVAKTNGFNVVQTEEYLPTFKGSNEYNRWYNLPHDGHWSDYGAEVYGKAMYEIIKEHLLVEFIKQNKTLTKCEKSLNIFNSGLDSLKAGNTKDALTKFTNSLESLDNTEIHATSYKECGFLVDLYNRRANIFLENGAEDKAIKDYESILKLVSEEPSVYKKLAEISQKQGDWLQALANYTKAIQFSPSEDLALYFARAQARQITGDHTGAIEDYSAAIKMAPTNPDFYLARGNVFATINKFSDAEQDYKNTIKLNRNYKEGKEALLQLKNRMAQQKAEKNT